MGFRIRCIVCGRAVHRQIRVKVAVCSRACQYRRKVDRAGGLYIPMNAGEIGAAAERFCATLPVRVRHVPIAEHLRDFGCETEADYWAVVQRRVSPDWRGEL